MQQTGRLPLSKTWALATFPYPSLFNRPVNHETETASQTFFDRLPISLFHSKITPLPDEYGHQIDLAMAPID